MKKTIQFCLSILFVSISYFTSAQVSGTMGWVPLTPGTISGITTNVCISNSDCTTDNLCFGLQYTPGATGVVTDYTTGFISDCVAGGNPVISNKSCIMNDNSGVILGCPTGALVNCSGNSGSTVYTQGVTLIIHQVCFSVAPGETININKDITSNLTTNIDLSGGGSVTDEPTYATFSLVRDDECPAIGLPIELISFNARENGETNLLHWASASEENSDKFIIERSDNSVDGFEEIGTVEAAGFSTEQINYSMIDEKPFNVSYYRLKMVDLDETYEYSDVVVVKRKTSKLSFTSIAPMPTRGLFEVSFESSSKEDVSFSITNMAGSIMHRQNSNASEDNLTSFDISNLPAGVYIINMTDGTTNVSEKIILTK